MNYDMALEGGGRGGGLKSNRQKNRLTDTQSDSQNSKGMICDIALGVEEASSEEWQTD